jgi:hypothetical protein
MGLKICDICGFEYEDNADDILTKGVNQCPYCGPIIELNNIFVNYSRNHQNKIIADPIYDRNLYVDSKYSLNDGTISYSLCRHDVSFEIKGRTRRVQGVIARIDKARDFLYSRIGPQFEILDSIYERHDPFWKEGGNLIGFVHEASFQYVVIKIKEMIDGSNSEFSIDKICKILASDKQYLYEKHTVTEIYKFLDSGDELRVPFDPFPIDDCLKKIKEVLQIYSKTISAISDIRDNYCAHFGKPNSENSNEILTYRNLKRIFGLLKKFYDGIAYSLSPDKFAVIMFGSKMWFSQLNRETQFFIDNYRNKIK